MVCACESVCACVCDGSVGLQHVDAEGLRAGGGGLWRAAGHLQLLEAFKEVVTGHV